MKKIILLTTHTTAILIGITIGIYIFPILTAPPKPTNEEIKTLASYAQYKGRFHKNLKGSDFLHWGKGEIAISQNAITLMGKLSPGPDYKLYLAPKFVETEQEFQQIKKQSIQIGSVKTFDNFIVKLPINADPSQYNTVVIWCETFNQFITAAKYR